MLEGQPSQQLPASEDPDLLLDSATISLWIANQRKLAGLSQEQLASKAGFSVSALKKHEAGTLSPGRALGSYIQAIGEIRGWTDEHCQFLLLRLSQDIQSMINTRADDTARDRLNDLDKQIQKHQGQLQLIADEARRLNVTLSDERQQHQELVTQYKNLVGNIVGRSKKKSLALIVTGFIIVIIGVVYGWHFLDQKGLKRDAKNLGILKTTGGIQIEEKEVTYNRYALCVKADICDMPTINGNSPPVGEMPITGIDAINAKKFCNWIERRLPTLQEWQIAVASTPWKSRLDNATPIL